MPTPSTNPSRRPPRPAARSGEAGFTLAELTVTLGVLTLVILGVLALFDLNSRIARTQTHVAEMQQSQRVAQQSIIKLARMAGRGGLPPFDTAASLELPSGVAVAIDNNVAAGVRLADCDCARVLPGTDVLTVRGIFTTPIYNSDPLNPSVFVPAAGGTGSLTLFRRTPTGAPQPLDELAEVVETAASGGTDALLLVNALGQYAVVEVTGGVVTEGDTDAGEEEGIASVQVSFVDSGGANTDGYRAMSQNGTIPAGFGQVAFAGILEEYRFYVRDRRTNPADAGEEVVTELTRARFYPNTDVPYRNDNANLTEVIADNILDLQAALGVDLDFDGAILEGTSGGTGTSGTGGDAGGGGGVARSADEWLFNDVDDDADVTVWNVANANLFYIRITTLARADRPTPQYQADELGFIEDKDYTASDFSRFNTFEERTYPRRDIQTTVDLRNL